MRGRMVAAWMLALVMALALSTGKAQAAEPLPEEAAVVVVDVSEGVPSSGGEVAWWSEAASGVLLSVGALIVSLVSGVLLKYARDNVIMKAAIRALETGVNTVWCDTVRKLKADASGGLSEREKQEARDTAIESAKKNASAPAKKLLEAMGKAALETLVSKIVRRRQSGR